MVKHVILWTLKDSFSCEEKLTIKQGIKEGLENLKDKIPGLLEIRVFTEGLETSNAEVMLDSSFADFDALKNYAKHPAHIEVADEKVRPFTASRSCFDFEV